MRRITTCVTVACLGMALTVSSSPVLVAGEVEGVIPRLAGPITIDGRLSEDAWRKAWRVTHHEFSLWPPNKTRQPVDEFVLRLFHDGTFLYVALASYDRYVESAARAENADGLYALSLLDRSGHPHHYRLRWSTPTAEAGGELNDPEHYAARLRGPYAEPRREGGGYVLEFAIPFKALDWRPGDAVALNVIIHDHDGNPGGRYDDPATRFTRFGFGSFDNDAPDGYRWLQLMR